MNIDIILRCIKMKLTLSEYDDRTKQKIIEASIKIIDELFGKQCFKNLTNIEIKKIFIDMIGIIYYYIDGNYNKYLPSAKRKMENHKKDILKKIDFISLSLSDNSIELKSIKEYLLTLRLKIDVYPSIYLESFIEPQYTDTKQILEKKILELFNSNARLKVIDRNQELKTSDYVYTTRNCKNVINKCIKIIDEIL